MAESTPARPHGAPRHRVFVRITHWTSAVSFVVLLVSGVAILLAHPRLYWGETGGLGTPSLVDLPLPFVLDVPIRGPGRYHLRLQRSTEDELRTYNVLQRLGYTGVVFGLFPLVVWTGLAMSPAVTSVFPFLVEVFGGQQSARTVHFVVACVLALFARVALVAQTGFTSRMTAMITGGDARSRVR